MAVSHNHSSPYYSSTAWGAWAFQDVFDIRFYETMAQRFADAVEQADEKTVPVRVSARTGKLDALHRNSMGPGKADDGTPAGYPNADSEHTFTVIRFDDISSKKPKPLAVLLSYSGHPEFLEGNNLLSADYLGPLERFVDRETGATTVFMQNAVGTAEPERSSFHDFHERLEFTHRQYGQAELGARMLADAVVGTWRAIGDQQAGGETLVPWMTSAPVQVSDRWFPGPLSHPYPTVSNCRTEPTVEGEIGVPVIGLPDCNRDADASGVLPDTPYSPGVPLPSNYSFPSYGSLQETLGIHLQALRIGDMLFTFCSCEQWKDQSRNIQTRTDKTPGNEYLGYEWPCEPADSLECRRMRAQVRNDAAGWNDPEYVLRGRVRARGPRADQGQLHPRRHGRERDVRLRAHRAGVDDQRLQRLHRHVPRVPARRPLPQGADRVRAALERLHGHAPGEHGPRAARIGRGEGRARGRADRRQAGRRPGARRREGDGPGRGRGDRAGRLRAARCPTTAARRRCSSSPPTSSASRPRTCAGAAATTTSTIRAWWSSGARATSGCPRATSRARSSTTVKFPAPRTRSRTAPEARSGSGPRPGRRSPAARPPRGRRTPPGTYRFTVSGARRTGGETVPYKLHLVDVHGQPVGRHHRRGRVEDGRPVFRVGPGGMRDGVTLNERRDGQPIPVRGPVGPIDYPDSYGGDLKPRFIDDQRTVVRDPAAPDDASQWEWYCLDCSFRPWLDAGDAERVTVTITGADGAQRRVAAQRTAPGAWALDAPLAAGESARVAAGDVLDAVRQLERQRRTRRTLSAFSLACGAGTRGE